MYIWSPIAKHIRPFWKLLYSERECHLPPGKGPCCNVTLSVESSWNVMARSDVREGKWRGNWRMEWVASTIHTTSECGVSSITTADAHTSAASSRLNWRPRRFKLTRPFRRKTKSGFCTCAITFQTQSTTFHRTVKNQLVDLQPRRLSPSPEKTIFKVFIEESN